MKKYIAILVASIAIIISVISCNQKQESTASSPEELAAGFQLLETNCFTCHSPKGSMEARVAPPMIAIKKHYINVNTSKEEFTQDLIAFVTQPSEDKSKMPGARKKFGLMPQMNLNKEQLTHIAAYLFETEIEAPDWFEEHYQQERKRHKGSNASLSRLEKGKQYALATKAILGKNLLNAINSQGAAHAVEFCNTQAIPLTDSMSTAQGVKIRRLSDQPRNPNNRATEPFLVQIQDYKTRLAAGEELNGGSVLVDGKTVYTYPIITNGMCMQCHGEKGTQIKPETLKKISNLYPTDQATGYTENQVRGVWVVEMEP